jgi:hypothetical protein
MLLALLLTVHAWPARASWWQDGSEEQASKAASVRASEFRLLHIDLAALKTLLAAAPEQAAWRSASLPLHLPHPEGRTALFRVFASPVMEPPLAEAYPGIRTFAGQGIDDPTATVRFGLTPFGLHAMVISVHGTWYIDPVDLSGSPWHFSYFKKQALPQGPPRLCLATGKAIQKPGAPAALRTVEGELRTYRLAIAATGEYTAFYGGTVAGALAGIVTTINRVNGVYEREFGIHLTIIANDTLLIFTNPSTDPYTNSSASAMLNQNQSTCSSVIGSANYDIGHVFGTGGGGIAELGVACVNFSKARGVTGLNAPIGDPFDIDYVAHEMGHQFGGSHTFNAVTGACNGNREPAAAYEPGSGSTIMAYAGICAPNNLQVHSDDYFHTHSFDEIIDFTQLSVGNLCPVKTMTANLAPVLAVPAGYTIPLGTPFRLTATASDPDGDPVTF